MNSLFKQHFTNNDPDPTNPLQLWKPIEQSDFLSYYSC